MKVGIEISIGVALALFVIWAVWLTLEIRHTRHSVEDSLIVRPSDVLGRLEHAITILEDNDNGN